MFCSHVGSTALEITKRLRKISRDITGTLYEYNVGNRTSDTTGTHCRTPAGALHRSTQPSLISLQYERDVHLFIICCRSSQGGDSAVEVTAAAAGGGSFPSTSPLFPESSVPMWRKVAVPGALALGAVGALGTFYAASRSAGGPNQSASSRHSTVLPHPSGATDAAAEGGYEYRGAGLAEEPDRGIAAAEDNPNEGPNGGLQYAQEGFHPSQHLEPAGPGEPSALAGEFRRLTETMEQQTGHMVEAVGAMKSLASRAEQDSSSLLAARISSHTSELRAELGNIKQLLLLQLGGEAGGGAGDVQSGASGAVGANAGKIADANDATLSNAGVAKRGVENNDLKAVGRVSGEQGKHSGTSEVPTKTPEEKAKEGDPLGGRGGGGVG